MNYMLDFSKYKRFFAFGCSFTRSGTWPTWADLLAMEMPDAKYYNVGITGAGNFYISSRISEVNTKYKFNKDDLVMVLWSTYLREDRFIKDRWQTYGSVYYNSFYDSNFVKKYFDPIGAMIRDLSLIDLTNGYMKSLECDYFDMLSVPCTFLERDDTVENLTFLENVLPPYKELLSKYKITYYDVYPWNEYIHLDDGHMDTHPTPLKAVEFLKALGFSLSDPTYDYAKQITDFLRDENRKVSIKEHLKSFCKSENMPDLLFNKYGAV